jgi:hypothetical protein
MAKALQLATARMTRRAARAHPLSEAIARAQEAGHSVSALPKNQRPIVRRHDKRRLR